MRIIRQVLLIPGFARAHRLLGSLSADETTNQDGLAPKPAEVRAEEAESAMARRDWPEAISRWRTIVELHGASTPATVHAALGHASRLQGDLAGAEAAIRGGLARYPKHGGLQAEHAEIAMARRDWPEAISRWRSMLATQGKNTPAAAYARLTRAYRLLGDFAAAETAIRDGLARYPKHVGLEAEQAEIAMTRRDWPEAISRWRTMVATHGKDAPAAAHAGLCRAYRLLGDLVAAEVAVLDGLAHHPNHAGLGVEYAEIAMGQRDWAEALSRWRAIVQTHGKNSPPVVRARLQEAEKASSGQNWLSQIPAGVRWQLAEGMFDVEIGALEATIALASRQATAVAELVSTFADAEGALAGHRQLYELQATTEIDDLSSELTTALRRIRALGRRTETMLGSFDAIIGRSVPTPAGSRQHFPRAAWREAIVKLALDVYRERGLQTSLFWLFRAGLVEDRAVLLANFGTAVREIDRAAAVRAFWLAYGTSPSPSMAERMAGRMYQSGDLSNSSALLRAAPVGASTAVASPYVSEMRSTVAMFQSGVEIPERIEPKLAGNARRIAYVASGSWPFQEVGYTVRTHRMLTALEAVGVECVCFTRPGYPWDRPRALAPGASVELNHIIGTVSYVHTPLPHSAQQPERLIQQMSVALEDHFRASGHTIVQAASNSRNALPALIAARRVGAKFIYEVRGLWELTAASRFAGWEETERYEFDRRLEVLVASHADHVLTITNGVAQELVKGGVSPERLSLLPNAVDPDAFEPKPKDQGLLTRLGLEQSDFTAVYAGSLTAYEGLDDLIIALSLIRHEGLSPKFVIVGDGEQAKELRAIAAQHDMADSVKFVGRVRPAEIQAYLSLADVVAMPRKPYRVCEIVTPLKPFEAMSMEKAVVLSDLPALREIVSDGDTGLLCKPADPADLAAVLKRLAADPALRTRLGREARKWVLDHHSWSANADTLVQLYRSLSGLAALPRDYSDAWGPGKYDRPPEHDAVYPARETSAYNVQA